MLTIGITGSIAAGKSTVDAILKRLGVTLVIDADQTVHDLYETSQPVQEALVRMFGPVILSPHGTIDRRALGARVFGNHEALRQLERVVHPAVRAAVRDKLSVAPDDTIAVIDAVKLLQSDLASLCTERWWITVSPSEQRRRLTEERHLTPPEIERRLDAQPRLEDWRHLVNRLIDNSGSLEETERQVEQAWIELTGRSTK